MLRRRLPAAQLGVVADAAQRLLAGLGLADPSQERLLHAGHTAGACGGKLSGAGGGGACFLICRDRHDCRARSGRDSRPGGGRRAHRRRRQRDATGRPGVPVLHHRSLAARSAHSRAAPGSRPRRSRRNGAPHAAPTTPIMTYAVLSDIHGNLEALQSVEATLNALPGSIDGCLMLGDLVGYNADPAACLARGLQLATHSVRGNHDKAVAGIASDRDFNPVAQAAVRRHRQMLAAVDLQRLSALPQGPLQAAPGVVLCHGAPRR